jgi:hypothetical protein
LYIGVFRYPLERPFTDTFPHSTQLANSAKAVLAPRGHIRQYVALPFDLNDSEINSISARQRAVFVSSEIVYFAAFKEKHTARMCLCSTGEDFSRGLLATYREGNDAD